ncbi:hypothetical protein [Streptococcus sp. 27098_8_69]|uniref:hypothetical protein n=1 Tax=Streptococcus sp. 27098_8_69 TaxID=3003664 RepID=UPI00352E9DAB
MTQVQSEQLSSSVIEARKKRIDDFERNHYQLSSLLKERLLETTDERFANKMNELLYYATQGSVFTFTK